MKVRKKEGWEERREGGIEREREREREREKVAEKARTGREGECACG